MTKEETGDCKYVPTITYRSGICNFDEEYATRTKQCFIIPFNFIAEYFISIYENDISFAVTVVCLFLNSIMGLF